MSSGTSASGSTGASAANTSALAPGLVMLVAAASASGTSASGSTGASAANARALESGLVMLVAAASASGTSASGSTGASAANASAGAPRVGDLAGGAQRLGDQVAWAACGASAANTCARGSRLVIWRAARSASGTSVSAAAPAPAPPTPPPARHVGDLAGSGAAPRRTSASGSTGASAANARALESGLVMLVAAASPSPSAR